MNIISLSSQSSHQSELEIFQVKQYGPGDECPYLAKGAQHCAAEIFERSRMQFINENCEKDTNFLKRQSILLKSVTDSIEKMLVNNQRKTNGAVVKVEFKTLDCVPTLSTSQVDNLFWARMEDLKFGNISQMQGKKSSQNTNLRLIKGVERSRGNSKAIN